MTQAWTTPTPSTDSGFFENPNGEIASLVTGRVVARIYVENLTTAEASQAMQAVLRALDATFPTNPGCR